MFSLYIKFAIAAIVLFIALLFGLFPILIRTNHRTRRILAYGESFAGGVFLGAGLIHLLPEAQQSFTAHFNTGYPVIFLVCALSILLLRVIEEGSDRLLNHTDQNEHTWLAFLLTILLSVHSVLAGIALGVETTLASLMIIFLAIIAHKGAAAFALGVNMRGSSLTQRSMVKLMILFSLMTPLGILFGTGLSAMLDNNSGQLAESLFNAVAAGTFIYIAAFHSVKIHCLHCEEGAVSTRIRLSCFTLGLVVMAIVAIWL